MTAFSEWSKYLSQYCPYLFSMVYCVFSSGTGKEKVDFSSRTAGRLTILDQLQSLLSLEHTIELLCLATFRSGEETDWSKEQEIIQLEKSTFRATFRTDISLMQVRRNTTWTNYLSENLFLISRLAYTTTYARTLKKQSVGSRNNYFCFKSDPLSVSSYFVYF